MPHGSLHCKVEVNQVGPLVKILSPMNYTSVRTPIWSKKSARKSFSFMNVSHQVHLCIISAIAQLSKLAVPYLILNWWYPMLNSLWQIHACIGCRYFSFAPDSSNSQAMNSETAKYLYFLCPMFHRIKWFFCVVLARSFQGTQLRVYGIPNLDMLDAFCTLPHDSIV